MLVQLTALLRQLVHLNLLHLVGLDELGYEPDYHQQAALESRKSCDIDIAEIVRSSVLRDKQLVDHPADELVICTSAHSDP